MWIKYLGGGVLLAVVGLWCARQAAAERQALRALERWIRCLHYVRGQVACFGTPFSEILTRAAPGLLPDGRMAAGLSLQHACRLAAPNLPGGSGELLCELSGELGTVFREEQLARLDHYLAALEKEEARCREKSREQMRLRSVLALSGVLSLLLLVW